MSFTRYRPVIDQHRCIGCGLCEETMPDVFRVGDFAASVVSPVVSAERLPSLEIAARDCPVNAISITPAHAPAQPERPISGSASRNEGDEGQNEEEGGEIAQYKRKHGDSAQADQIQPDDAKSLQSGKHHLSIVRDGTHNN